MDLHQNARIKWPYVTHLVDPRAAAGLLPVVEETNPGSLMLGRVVTIGRHKDLETHAGRRMTLYPGDLFVGALGNRYATDQFEAVARCWGPLGHIVGIGGVCGEVVSMNTRMTEPTVVEWLGRLAGADGQPLHLSDFHLPRGDARPSRRPVTVLSLGASMNSGKTTTAAQLIHSLAAAGHRVAAAKLTGTACVKDPNLLYDSGASVVLDFTHAGWPSTAGCSLEQLLGIASHLRAVLDSHEPEFVVMEIADGIVQRETAMMLADPGFRDSIDAVTFAGPDALSCDAGVRRLRALGYQVLATAGFVANGRLGIQETEAACGVRCVDGASIVGGALVPALRELRDARREPRRRDGSARGGEGRRAVARAARPASRAAMGVAAAVAVAAAHLV
jgi:hypothetical protein